MFFESTLPPDLIRAYRETHYKVPSLNLTLVIDQANSDLSLAQQKHGTDCSAFITACNPLSEAFSMGENERRQANLAAELLSHQCLFTEGIGQHPSGEWEGEPSFLVFGFTQEKANLLCRRFEQNAFVWCGADAIPRLILLR